MTAIKITYTLPNLEQSKRYDIGNKQIEEKRTQGIYALFVNETLVYIGKSVNVLQRIRQQKYVNRGKIFTDFTFVELEHATREELNLFETIYIDYYKPSWNKIKRYRR